MASSEAWVIINPKHNNKDLLVSYVDPRGNHKLFARLQPGQSCSPDRSYVTIQERDRPSKLEQKPDGTLARDTSNPKNIRRVG